MASVCPTKLCEMCGVSFSQGLDEGPKRFTRRRYCSRKCGATTHNESRSQEYRIWWSMLKRCELPSDSGYQKYGARGVTVCDEWHSFDRFLSDMGRRPSPNHSIDRIDGGRGYEKSNCRWATRREQQNNIKSNRHLTVNGETHTVSEWARITGLGKTLDGRLRLGWSHERAVLTPSRGRAST